jgi:hypothetical protein
MKKIKENLKRIICLFIAFIFIGCSNYETRSIYDFCGGIVMLKTEIGLSKVKVVDIKHKNEFIKINVYDIEYNKIEEGDTIKCN